MEGKLKCVMQMNGWPVERATLGLSQHLNLGPLRRQTSAPGAKYLWDPRDWEPGPKSLSMPVSDLANQLPRCLYLPMGGNPGEEAALSQRGTAQNGGKTFFKYKALYRNFHPQLQAEPSACFFLTV
jgi:hypothetical protein